MRWWKKWVDGGSLFKSRANLLGDKEQRSIFFARRLQRDPEPSLAE